MIEIGHEIIAVPERSEYVQQLLSRTGIDERHVFWDEEHRGCMWNAIRAWRAGIESGATHWCVMADDTDVVNNYAELERICVSTFPDAIWTFYSNELSRKHRGVDTPYVLLTGYNIRGIAFVLPVRHIAGYVQLCEKMLSEYGYQRDDATCRMYALFNNIPVMTTIPNLVRSHEIKSAMSGHGITHNSDTWFGYDIPKGQFMTDKVVERKIAAKSALETHLKPDNPMDIKVRSAWKRMMMLRGL